MHRLPDTDQVSSRVLQNTVESKIINSGIAKTILYSNSIRNVKIVQKDILLANASDAYPSSLVCQSIPILNTKDVHPLKHPNN